VLCSCILFTAAIVISFVSVPSTTCTVCHYQPSMYSLHNLLMWELTRLLHIDFCQWCKIKYLLPNIGDHSAGLCMIWWVRAFPPQLTILSLLYPFWSDIAPSNWPFCLTSRLRPSTQLLIFTQMLRERPGPGYTNPFNDVYPRMTCVLINGNRRWTV